MIEKRSVMRIETVIVIRPALLHKSVLQQHMSNVKFQSGSARLLHPLLVHLIDCSSSCIEPVPREIKDLPASFLTISYKQNNIT